MKNKELHRPYSTRPKTGQRRLEEVIQYQRQLYDSSYAPNDLSKDAYKSSSGLNKYRIHGGKKVFNYYHFKTHFKSIEHFSVVNNSKADISKSILERYRLVAAKHNNV